MLVKLDWLSFSIPMDTAKMEYEQDAPAQIIASLEHLHPDLPEWLSLGDRFEARNGRAPYRTAWSREDGGLVVFSHPLLPHALLEISGRGCDRLQDLGKTNDVLSAVARRVTRLDLACDILTDTRPKDFVEGREIGRFKANSYVSSESGETAYVGAKTSDRYARVYRYNHPHERSHFLRVEYVVKGENAKITSNAILEQGARSVVATLGRSFGWVHDDWRLDDEAAELAVYRPDRREGKTLFWLSDTIAPLLVRLHKQGTIDVQGWFADTVLTRLND